MWWRRRRQDDFHEEIQSHLQIEIDRLIEQGATEEEAKSAALRAFGNVTTTQERFYESRRWMWADHLAQDIRYAARILLKSPVMTATAIATMALGIGATTAIFTVTNAVLLRPLPYPESDRLVMCLQRHAQFGPEVVTLPDYRDWRDQSASFSDLAGAWNQQFNLTGVDQPERVPGASVTSNLFRTFGTAPFAGRTISKENERGVVLGYALWQRRFAGSRDVLGKSVTLNGSAFTVIGIMPPEFTFPAPAELWVPLVPESAMNRGYHQLWVVGRLKPGETLENARAALAAIAGRAAKEFPATNSNWGVQVSTLQDHVAGSSRRPILILTAAVACLLLLACANVAGLLLSRASGRRHEMSIRAALGARSWQIIQLLLMESMLLSVCGGAIGLALATWSIEPLLKLTALPRADEIYPDRRVLLFTLAASLGTGILAGFAPAAAALRRNLRTRLTVRGGTPGALVRPGLVSFQIAVAAVLLTGSGLLMRSFHRLQQVETGFDAGRVLTASFFLPRAAYPGDRRTQLYSEMVERMERLTGVEAAAAVSAFPFAGVNASAVFELPDRPAIQGELRTADFRSATPGFFRTMGISLLSGRDFQSDTAQSQFVAIVNRAFVDRFFAGRSPLGHFVRIIGPKPRMVVGVIQNIRHRGLDSPVEPEVYVPNTQFPQGMMFLAVRARTLDPLTLAAPVRAEIRRLDPDLPIARMQTWTQLLDSSLSGRRFSLTLLTIFAVIALVLSAIGIYGMLSFHVSQRSKEIAIRLALGALPRNVVRKAVWRGMAPVSLGLIAGLAGALSTTRYLESMLFETRPADSFTLLGVVVLMLGVAVIACWLPARRAARVDPMKTLRYE